MISNFTMYLLNIMKYDIQNLDFNLLKTFDALFDERSVTGAAKRLHLTQPAVSGMLQRLRDYFEDPLFTRTQRGITPTLRALELSPIIKNIIFDINTLLKPQFFDPLNAELILKIAATDYALKAILVDYIAALRIKAPNIKVSIVPVKNDEVFSQLEQGLIDFALVTPENCHSKLHTYSLFNEKYSCLVHTKNPLALNEKLTIDEFCSMDHALISHDGGEFNGITDQQLKYIKKQRNVVLSVNNFMILPEILAVTDLIAVVPSRLVKNLKDFKIFEPPIKIPEFTKIVAWHDRNHRDIAQQWLRDLLIKISNQTTE